MKKLTTLILTFLPLLIWAHKDKYYTYQYGNVTVRIITGFYPEEINNVKIIGKYASLLSDSLDYDKPILLDFIHDYGYTYQGKTYSFLNSGSEEYDIVSYYESRYDSLLSENVLYMVPYSNFNTNSEHILKEVYTVPPINSQKKIVIRQFGFQFNIAHTLNLLCYAINNNAEIRQLSVEDSLSSYLINMYYRFESVPTSLIDSIKYLSSRAVERVLQNRVYREVDTIDRHSLYYSYFSQNGKLLIFAGIHDREIILDTLDQVYSVNQAERMPEHLFVFESPNQMRMYNLNVFMDYECRRSKKHILPVDRNDFIMSIDIEWSGDDKYLINYNNGFETTPFKRFLYSENDDVIIEN